MAAGAFGPWQLAVLVGWDVAALVLVGTIWMFIAVLDGVATRSAAAREDLSTASDDLVVLVASIVSLVGVLLALVEARRADGAVPAILTVVAVLTVVISWLAVQTIFTLRYARLYYESPPGGIDFPGSPSPDYRDFVYLAFTIGMTFQVSDTPISASHIRRTVTRHALIGYLFGTVIVGVTINVVGGLVG